MFKVVRFVLSPLLLLGLAAPAIATAEADPLCELRAAGGRPEQVPNFQFQALPSFKSADFRRLREDALRQLQETGSYAIINLRPFLDRYVGAAWWMSLNTGSEGAFISHNFGDDGFVPNPNARIVREGASVEQLAGIQVLRHWFNKFMRGLGIGQAQSHWTANSVQVRGHAENGRGMRQPFWQTESGGFGIILPLYGTSPEVFGSVPAALRDEAEAIGYIWERRFIGRPVIVVPEGHALIFVGRDAGRPWEPTIWRNGDSQMPYVAFHLR